MSLVIEDAPAPLAISVQNLTKTFDAVRAVDGISFGVPQGSVIGLLGGNGAGKTTTISILLGLLTATTGTVRVLGVNMAERPEDALPFMNFSSPYVELPRRLTVRENLTVYAKLYGVLDVPGRIHDLAEELDLSRFIDRDSGTLSAGQKTRVAIAKALLNEPRLLLLDEPTASLDPDTGDRIRGYLETYRARSGATILLASHNMSEVERLCDNVLMMRAGKIQAEGSPDQLIAQYGRANMEEVFLHIARGADGLEHAGMIKD